VNNEWDWEDPRPKSPIPWEKLATESRHNDNYGESKYVLEAEPEPKLEPE